MRLRSAAAALFCAAGLPLFLPAIVHAQKTTVTGTGITMGGVAIPAGTVTITPVNAQGYPVGVVTSDGSVYANGPGNSMGIVGTIAAGAITGTFQVPDQCTAHATVANTPLYYQVELYNSAPKSPANPYGGYTSKIGSVQGVCGSTWALNAYAPTQSVMIAPTGLVSGATVPAHCTAPSIYYPTAGGKASKCVAGVYVQDSSSGGVTLPSTSALLKGDGSGGAAAGVPGADYATPAAVAANTAAIGNEAARATAAENVLTARAGGLVSGYNAYINFAAQAAGSGGTTGTDLSGSGNSCTLSSGNNYTAGGVVLGSASQSTKCVFPASASLTDNTLINDRTLQFCGYKAPFNRNSFPTYDHVFGGSDNSRIGSLWMSGRASGSPYGGRLQGYMGTFTFGGASSVSTTPVTGWHCYTWVLGSASDSSKDRFFVDDAELSYSAQFVSGTIYGTRAIGDRYTLGSADWEGSFFGGIASAVVAYPGPLSAAQVAANWRALQYLAFTQYGVGLPLTQSYSRDNLILADGDSLTDSQGVSGVRTWPTLLGTSQAPLNTTFVVRNNAQAGNLLYNIIADIPQLDVAAFSPLAKYTFASNAGGINDLNIGGFTADEIVLARIGWAKRMKLLGFQVLMPTMIDSGGQSATLQSANASLRAYAGQNPGVYTIVDWANEPCLGASGANADPGGLACGVPGAGKKVVSPASCAVSGNVATVTASNTFAVGDLVWVYLNAGGCTSINNANTPSNTFYTITSATSSAFSFAVSNADVASYSSPGGQIATIYQADTVHATTIGEVEMARLYANVTNYLTGSTEASPTAVTAATYSMQAGDRYITANGSTAQTVTLPPCYGWNITTPFMLYNAAATTLTVSTSGILNGAASGSASVAPRARGVFFADITPGTASGCQWYSR